MTVCLHKTTCTSYQAPYLVLSLDRILWEWYVSNSLVWLPVVRTDTVPGRCFIVACHRMVGGAVSQGLVWLWLA